MQVIIELPYIATKTSEVIKAVHKLEKEFQEDDFMLKLGYVGGPYKCENGQCLFDLNASKNDPNELYKEIKESEKIPLFNDIRKEHGLGPVEGEDVAVAEMWKRFGSITTEEDKRMPVKHVEKEKHKVEVAGTAIAIIVSAITSVTVTLLSTL